jgi:hypothetical protein
MAQAKCYETTWGYTADPPITEKEVDMTHTDRTSATATPVTAAPPADSKGQEKAEQNLATFDRLDFEGWNGRNWELFRQLHTEDVKVVGFGSTTQGIDDHEAWAKAFIKENPDSQIMVHPIRIGAGDWTAVTGVMDDGLVMATIARWENGRVAEEYLLTLSG